MIRSALPTCLIAALHLAGCGTTNEPPPAATMRTTDGRPVVSASARQVDASAAHRPGSGIIESISLVNRPESASAGGTSPLASGPYRITIRMDDGSIQPLIVNSRAFLVGDRVQILSDGSVIRS